MFISAFAPTSRRRRRRAYWSRCTWTRASPGRNGGCLTARVTSSCQSTCFNTAPSALLRLNKNKLSQIRGKVRERTHWSENCWPLQSPYKIAVVNLLCVSMHRLCKHVCFTERAHLWLHLYRACSRVLGWFWGRMASWWHMGWVPQGERVCSSRIGCVQGGCTRKGIVWREFIWQMYK